MLPTYILKLGLKIYLTSPLHLRKCLAFRQRNYLNRKEASGIFIGLN